MLSLREGRIKIGYTETIRMYKETIRLYHNATLMDWFPRGRKDEMREKNEMSHARVLVSWEIKGINYLEEGKIPKCRSPHNSPFYENVTKRDLTSHCPGLNKKQCHCKVVPQERARSRTTPRQMSEKPCWITMPHMALIYHSHRGLPKNLPSKESYARYIFMGSSLSPHMLCF